MRSTWIGLAGLAALVLAMFFDVLFAPGDRVLGNIGTDLATQFLYWRQFGFREMAGGHIALWNPHIYAGAPYFGGMQAALLYPVNWLFLVLPLVPAVNWTIAVNVWLLGSFMFLWALRRDLHPLAAFTAGALLMFCTPHFLHIYAGHLTNLAAMAWAPLIFLAIDEWFRSRRFGWCLLGMLAVAMQVLAGHPQYVLYTAITCGGYSLVRLILENGERLKTAAALLTIHPGGALLAAAQLVIGFQSTQETVRGKRLPFSFVAEFDFPVENLLTLVAPGFFGNVQFYWGEWRHLWEMSLFIGVVGLALALYGMVRAETRGKVALLCMLPVTLVLALGDGTPVLHFLYEVVPGFDRFRAVSKFVFQTALILVLFAAVGLDRILRTRTLEPGAIWAAGGGAAVLCALAWGVRLLDWKLVMLAVWSTGKVFIGVSTFGNARFVANAQQFASDALLLGGTTLAVAAAAALWVRFNPRAIGWLAFLAIVEVFAVARLSRDTFSLSEVSIPYFGDAASQSSKDFRIMNVRNPNSAMFTGQYELWGNDPGVASRYAEFIFWSEGASPDRATQFILFKRFHPMLSLARLKYATRIADEGNTIVFEAKVPPMPRIALLGSYRVIEGRDAILQALGADSFDPRREVIVEKQPDPRPVAAESQGHARIIGEGSDFLDIEAETGSPSLLLVTDAWTPSWRATALAGSTQAKYEVLPANYAFRGVPLAAGKHRLRLEYAPSAYPVGWWVSAGAWMLWLACWVPWLRGLRRAKA